MSNRSCGPRWELLGAAAAIVAVLAAAAFAANSGLIGGMSEAGSWGLRDWLELGVLIASVIGIFAVPILVLAAFLLPARRAVDRDWRRRLSLYRTTGALARMRPDPAAAARACARLDDDALRVAAILPSHSEAGRAAAQAELNARGLALEPIPDVCAPSFYGVDDLADARRDMQATSRIRTICGAIGFLLLATAFVLIGINKFAVDPVIARANAEGFGADVAAALDSLSFDSVPPEILAWREMAGMQQRDIVAKACVALMIPFALVLFFASWLRARPMRILLLRKFNDRGLGKTYNKLLSNELQQYGHVIALADKHVRRSTLAWLAGMLVRGVQSIPNFLLSLVMIPTLLVLRLTDRTRWGPAFVGAPRDFRLLARRLFDRLELNVETTFISKGYLVRTTDPWWRLVVQLMMGSADVIVLDASNVTDGTAWEIDAVARFGFWDRVVRVAVDGQAQVAEAAFAAAPPAPLFTYDGSGRLADEAGFKDAMFAALERSVRARAS